MKIPAPDNIQSIHPYIPGKPIEEVKRELGISDILKLASNENPLGSSPMAMEAYVNFVDQLSVYPEGGGFYLCEALGRHFGVTPKRIILGNGSIEIVEMAARAYLNGNTNAVFSRGSFAMYPIACQIMAAPTHAVPMEKRNHDLGALLDAIDRGTRLVILDNPINPTGRYASFADIKSFLEKVPGDVLVILDEAYKEFVQAPDYASAKTLMDDFPNLVVLGTFSKAYGLAALRIGYGFAQPEVLETLHKVRSPFNSNAVAQHCAIAALKDQEFVKRCVALNTVERAYLAGCCKAMGLGVTPSETNFLLVDVPMEGSSFFEALLREGIVVRPMGGYGLPGSVRVTVHLREGNDRFMTAAKKILGG